MNTNLSAESSIVPPPCRDPSEGSRRFMKRNGAPRGLSTTKAYASWERMVNRCHNPNFHQWKNYGGRGITVCNRWRTFLNFYADMGDRPEGKTLDRVDNDGGYSPANCRWATLIEQRKYRSDNHRVTVGGETRTLAEWTRLRGFKETTISDRLIRGWDAARAVNTPLYGAKENYRETL